MTDLADDWGRDDDGRDETPIQALDRHWTELLQELRVILTGAQLLTGFLLTLPFQQRFSLLSHVERSVYLATIACAVTATTCLQAPVIVHRVLFRKHQRKATVQVAQRLSIIGTALLAATFVGVTFLMTDVLLGAVGAAIAAGAALLFLVGVWGVLPFTMWRRAESIRPVLPGRRTRPPR